MLDIAGEWGRFLVGRVLYFVVSLVLVSIITFFVTNLLGNPVYLLVGTRYTEERLENVTRELGLDKPITERYATYIGRLLQGDLGVSRYTFNPVMEDIQSRLPATLELSTFALFLAVLWAVPAGIIAGVRPNGVFARFADLLARAGVSMPGFWLGLLFIFVFYAEMRLFPAPLGRIPRQVGPPPTVTGWYTVDSLLAGDIGRFIASLRQLLLPSLTLAITTSPSILQITRNRMREVMASDYVRAARGFGLPRSLINRYAVKNILAPVITMIAMTYGYLLSGTVLVEVIFSWPGLGLYAVDAMNHSDYEPIMGVVLLTAGFYLFIYFLADILNALLDPRVRVQE